MPEGMSKNLPRLRVLKVEKKSGTTFDITARRSTVSRGGKGTQLFKRGELVKAHVPIPHVPDLTDYEEDE